MKEETVKIQGPTIKWLLTQIDAFIDLNDMKPDGQTFGWYVLRKSCLVEKLREGGDITTTTMDNILSFMQEPATITRAGLNKKLPLKPLNIKRRTIP